MLILIVHELIVKFLHKPMPSRGPRWLFKLQTETRNFCPFLMDPWLFLPETVAEGVIVEYGVEYICT